jgi:GNAT superfamily N-acetyltransferase
MIVRLAAGADSSRIRRTAARAFAADPLITWMVGSDAHDVLETFFELPVSRYLGAGEVWVTDDVVAVAMWRPPAAAEADPRDIEVMQRAWSNLDGLTHARIATVTSLFEEHQPSEPHWYLGVLGVHPDWQGRGLARAVMASVRQRADANSVPMYLETATAADVAYYARLGFDIVDELQVLPDGPHIWTMSRRPGTATDSWAHRPGQ